MSGEEALMTISEEKPDSSLLDFVFFSSRRRHTRLQGDWSSDVCSSDLHQRDQPHPRRQWHPEGVHRSEEHTSELQSPCNLVCRLLLEKKKKTASTLRGSAGRRLAHPAALARIHA